MLDLAYIGKGETYTRIQDICALDRSDFGCEAENV